MRFVPSTGRAVRRSAVIGIAAIVVVGFVVTAVWVWGGTSPAAAAKTTTIEVKRGTLTVTASASGTVAAINEQALTFGTSGTLATVSVKAGQTVAAGQTLATIDPADATAAVTQAQSALDAAQTNLTLAEQQAASPSPSATSTCAQARTAAYVVATHSASPSPSASPTATTTPTPKPTTKKSPTPAPTHTTCVSTGGGNGNGGGNGQGGSQNGSGGTDNLLRAQQSVNNDQLTLERAQDALAGTTIVAPSAGRVLSVAGAVGDKVSGGGSGFIVLTGVNSVAVEASFSEADVAPIKVGQTATVTLANHAGVTYPATVTQIDPAGTVSGSLVKFGVQLAFVDPPAGLLLGQSATVAVTTDSVADAVYVPAGAVSMSGATSTVTVRTGKTDSVRTVTTGLSGDQGLQITSGLTQGETVVIHN